MRWGALTTQKEDVKLISRYRNIIRLFILLIFAGAVYLFLTNYLKASLTFKIQDNQSVSIVSVNEKAPKKAVWDSQVPGDYHIKINRGSYSVTITNGEEITSYYVDLAFRENRALEFSLEQIQQIVPYENTPATSIKSYGENDIVFLTKNGTIKGLEDELQPKTLGISPIIISFAEKDSTFKYLAVDGFGRGYLVGNSTVKPVFDIHDEDTGTEQPGIVSVDFDETSNTFCLLDNAGSLFAVSASNGSYDSLGNFDSPDNVACNEGVITVSRLSKPTDGEKGTSFEPYFMVLEDSEVIYQNSYKDIPLTNVIPVGRDIGVVYVLGNKIEILSPNGDKKVIGSVDSPETAYLFTNKQPDKVLYLFESNNLWKLDPNNLSASRVASTTSFSSVKPAVVVEGTNSVLLSVQIGTTTGIFKTTSNNLLIDAWDMVKFKVPYTDPDFIVEAHTQASRIQFKVTILAPVPSSGDTSVYDEAKSNAEKYIKSIGLPDSIYSISY